MTENLTYSGGDAVSYFGQARSELWVLIPQDAQRILDIGCGAGALGVYVKNTRAVSYCGIEQDPSAAEVARKELDEVHVGDAASMRLPYDKASFDLLIFADVLEHFPEPSLVLSRWLSVLKPGGCVLVSLPNVRHFSVTLPLLLKGEWNYTDRGILDRTHLRFFTKKTAVLFLKECDLIIEKIEANTRYRYSLIKWLDKGSLGVLRDHFVQQWLILATKRTIDPSPIV